MKEAIKNARIIKHVVMGDILDDFNKDAILSLLEKPLPIKIGDDGLYYIDENGSNFKCPNSGLNITADGKWLSDKIVDVPFDIDQGGNIGKAEEAYCLSIVIMVLKGNEFLSELKNAINNDIFKTMSGIDYHKTFSVLLEEWQNLESITINIVVSAAKYKISAIKKRFREILKREYFGRPYQRIAKP